MRLNRYIALAVGIGRRQADDLIKTGKVNVDGQTADLGHDVKDSQEIMLDGKVISLPAEHLTIMINKPAGIVVSRDGQGNKTIYDILPDQYKPLKPIGRLDKNSSGLILLTTDGQLAQSLTHPSMKKDKLYKAMLNKRLTNKDEAAINSGIKLEDGISRLVISDINTGRKEFIVRMSEGRNRQIRRTFASLGYEILKLHRFEFGNYKIDDLKTGEYKIV